MARPKKLPIIHTVHMSIEDSEAAKQMAIDKKMTLGELLRKLIRVGLGRSD